MSQESDKRAIISPTLHHCGILTARTEEMIHWYARVLGMTTNFRSTTSGIASFADLHRRAYAGEFPPSRPMDPSVLL
jgi:catechol 2,3-dioxygenase-like lactoylglutathione lyase family enzyme